MNMIYKKYVDMINSVYLNKYKNINFSLSLSLSLSLSTKNLHIYSIKQLYLYQDKIQK